MTKAGGNRLLTKDLVAIALLAALLLGVQVGFSFLPNLELVSLLLLLYTRFFRQKTLYIIYVFVLLEGLVYGFGLWWVCYLYVWSILWGIATLLHKEKSPVVWAFVSGFFGLAFGTLCSVPYFITGGAKMGAAWIASGLSFDLLHGVGNLLVALVLYSPLCGAFSKVYRLYYGEQRP